MRDFITCLEFLTRVRFSKRTDWRDEDFSRSVPYFPLVGLVIGLLLAGVNYGLFYIDTPLFLRVTLLLLAEIIITGGLMYDGFMDTADGVFSARSRARMLEIMKDSHVGSNAVLAIIILLLLKIAAYLEINGAALTWVLLAMSVATRTFMVVFIVNFPYAKPAYTYIAFALCGLIIWACGVQYLAVAAVCFALTLVIAHYLKAQLGGLTGDTYGALTECGNVIYLLTAVFLLR